MNLASIARYCDQVTADLLREGKLVLDVAPPNPNIGDSVTLSGMNLPEGDYEAQLLEPSDNSGIPLYVTHVAADGQLSVTLTVAAPRPRPSCLMPAASRGSFPDRVVLYGKPFVVQ
jgi:hypothetical protein